VEGKVTLSLGKNQRFEVQCDRVEVLGECPPEYPLQKKRHSQEFLRGLAHLRARTNTHSAIARVRSRLAFATHEFFQSQGFVYLQVLQCCMPCLDTSYH
jgi:asparaginyl-tRNA synthetase